jgi:hypothetical protein
VSYWFADVDREAVAPYVWQPCLETETGHIPCFEVWFRTERECEDWIRQFVVGAPLRAGEDRP